jgi:hypothetical protein
VFLYSCTAAAAAGEEAVTLDQYTRGQLARFAIEEAVVYGGIKNMLCVVHVLRNRVMAGWGDWTEVVQRAPEKRAHSSFALMPNLRTANVRNFLAHVDEVYTRVASEDMTGGALFYFDSNKIPLKWFKDEVIERPDDHPRCAQCGPVWFYK